VFNIYYNRDTLYFRFLSVKIATLIQALNSLFWFTYYEMKVGPLPQKHGTSLSWGWRNHSLLTDRCLAMIQGYTYTGTQTDGRIYKVCYWDGLKCNDLHTKLQKIGSGIGKIKGKGEVELVMSGYFQGPTTLPLDRKLGETQNWCECCEEKNLALNGNQTLAVQPTVHSYTDWAIPTPIGSGIQKLMGWEEGSWTHHMLISHACFNSFKISML
jgi:hypothetical protein